MGLFGQPGGQVLPLPGAISLDSVLINLNASTNNLPFGQFVSLIKLLPSAALNITGLMFGIADRQVLLSNVGAFVITLKNADGGSSAVNQFLFGADVTLGPGAYVCLVYSAELFAWTLVSNSASSGGGGGGQVIAAGTVNADGTLKNGVNVTGSQHIVNPGTGNDTGTYQVDFTAAGFTHDGIVTLSLLGATGLFFANYDLVTPTTCVIYVYNSNEQLINQEFSFHIVESAT